MPIFLWLDWPLKKLLHLDGESFCLLVSAKKNNKYKSCFYRTHEQHLNFSASGLQVWTVVKIR